MKLEAIGACFQQASSNTPSIWGACEVLIEVSVFCPNSKILKHKGTHKNIILSMQLVFAERKYNS
jgi:hypothetical protein